MGIRFWLSEAARRRRTVASHATAAEATQNSNVDGRFVASASVPWEWLPPLVILCVPTTHPTRASLPRCDLAPNGECVRRFESSARSAKPDQVEAVVCTGRECRSWVVNPARFERFGTQSRRPAACWRRRSGGSSIADGSLRLAGQSAVVGAAITYPGLSRGPGRPSSRSVPVAGSTRQIPGANTAMGFPGCVPKWFPRTFPGSIPTAGQRVGSGPSVTVMSSSPILVERGNTVVFVVFGISALYDFYRGREIRCQRPR